MCLFAEPPIYDLRPPASVAIASLAAIGYMVSLFRSGKTDFGVVDAMIIVIVVAILGASAIPLVEKANRQAESSALLQNLHTLRSQIEVYKAEHDGRPPLLYEGSFPQLIRATNAAGMPGPPGEKYPFGPYLTSGIPANPVTDRSVVTASETFPPENPSGNGGWLYHQQSGQIAPDVPGYLDR